MKKINIGNKIINLRKKYNFTQEKLSELIGVSRQTLSNWENNITSPDLKEVTLLAKVFKISLDELANNDLEIKCKENNVSEIFKDIIEKSCYITFSDEYFDLNINEQKSVKVLNINEDFIKIEYKENKKTKIKLIDMNLIDSIFSLIISHSSLSSKISKVSKLINPPYKKSFPSLKELIGKNIEIESDEYGEFDYNCKTKGKLKKFNETWIVIETTDKKNNKELYYYRLKNITSINLSE